MKPTTDRDIEKGYIGEREEVEFQLWWELS